MTHAPIFCLPKKKTRIGILHIYTHANVQKEYRKNQNYLFL